MRREAARAGGGGERGAASPFLMRVSQRRARTREVGGTKHTGRMAQVGALLPGISRSGSTLSAALALGFQRDEAARFSFLLGLPAIALAGLKELWELHNAHLNAYGWSVLALGLVVASISAFFAIWSLMRILERFTAWPFVIYRAVLGVVLLAGVATGLALLTLAAACPGTGIAYAQRAICS
jgi:hypothetical protein